MYSNDYGYDNNNHFQHHNQYGYDNSYRNYYPESEFSSRYPDIQKLKCVNSNINVNDIDIKQIPQNGPNVAAANKGAGEEIAHTANTQNGNGLADRINVERTS